MVISSKDVLSGAVTSVIILSSTLGYAAFIFSGPLIGALHYAVGFGLISAGVMAIVISLGCSAPFAIAGPDSRSAAVLAIMASLMTAELSRTRPGADIGLMVLAALVTGTIATGVALYALGASRTGKWIRFVPYPVIGGFMAASGWLVGVGGVGVLTGTHMSWGAVPELGSQHHLLQLAAGLAVATAAKATRRIKTSLAFPVMLVAGVAIVHLLLAANGVWIEAAREAGWLLNVGKSAEVANLATLARAAHGLDGHTIGLAAGEFIGLVAVTAMTLLLGLVVIEVESRLDIDLDYELRLNGIANILTGLAGGMVGTLSVSRTLFNFRAGGHDVCHSLILDFRQVLGIDSSAILNLSKLWNFAEREGFIIAVSSLPPSVEKALRGGGLLQPHDKVGKLFSDLDAALEWCEDSLIAERVNGEAAMRSADEWLAREIGGRALFDRLAPCLDRLEVAAGETLFAQGAAAEELFLLYAGRVSVLLTTASGAELRLRSIAGQTVIGEMGLYRAQRRGAAVRADTACVLYRLTSRALASVEDNDPQLAYAFHKFIVRILAERLEFANRQAAEMHS